MNATIYVPQGCLDAYKAACPDVSEYGRVSLNSTVNELNLRGNRLSLIYLIEF